MLSKKYISYLSIFFLISLIGYSCKRTPDPAQNSAIVTPGWEGNSEYFRMENDAIVAGNLNTAIPNNEFLCTEKSYKNFEIKLQAKLTGEGQNAGIQFRSKRIPDHFEVIGYQCDMGRAGDQSIWGALYDESRRREFLVLPPSDSIRKVLKENDWNQFIIRAEGPRIQIWLNGFQTVDYVEQVKDIDEEGIICLQIHSGPPAEAWYKDIEIKEL